MEKLWMRIIRKHKIIAQHETPCAQGQEREALVELCREADLPAPMWLDKHQREFERFRFTAFLPDHFVEEVAFDRLEIELFDDEEKEKKKVSRDPRNAF
jgi:hypothetical protein